MTRRLPAKLPLRPQRIARLTVLAAALAAALPSQAATKPAKPDAEAERIKALEQKLEQSLGVIEQLKARLTELEKKAAAPAAAKPTPALAPLVAPAQLTAVEQRVEQVEQSVQQMVSSAANAKPADTGIPVHGFLDVGYSTFNKQADGQRSGARLGTFDLYLNPNIGSNIRTLLEIAFEYDKEGKLGIDAERLQVGYAFSDQFVLWGGRFHTPYGYWNTAFHHGAQLQTPVTRPRFVAYEDQGGILPSHTVGLWATGKFATSVGKVEYNAFAGNGDRVIDGVLDYNASGDNNSSPIVGGSVGWSPSGVSGLTLGLHAFQSKVGGNNADNTFTGNARSRVIGGYGYWEGDSFELIGEYYRFSNRDLTTPGSKTKSSQAAFIQASYNLMDRLYGFVRYEKASLKDDGYFTLLESGSSYNATSVGLRYDLDPRAALKFQYDVTKDVANPLGKINALRAQVAVRF